MHQQYTKIIFDEHLDEINYLLIKFVHKDDLYIVQYLFSILNKDILLYVRVVLISDQLHLLVDYQYHLMKKK
jgi:hypothetical protein